MIQLLRYLLFPIAVIYGWITAIRNLLFDYGVLKSYSFDLPVIAVGNLSTGGTGKTPQIEYLIRLLSTKYNVATLSRGYKRKSKGFILADDNSDAASLGDEPYQFYKKFPKIQVAVDADRKNGIEKLLQSTKKPQIILLDDAFQHRKVKAGFYILLSTYSDLYANDFMLPTGNLREYRKNACRADVIIITKCPKEISKTEQEKLTKLLKISDLQKVFFSRIDFEGMIYSDSNSISVAEISNQPKLLLAGIANPTSFFDYLKNKSDITLTFPDHHHFSEKDIENIRQKAKNHRIITTEKDYVRLADKLPKEQLYYLPIKSAFVSNSDVFDTIILNYVESSSRNS